MLLLSPKKRPSTPRGTHTYQALVTATGYEVLTTNHVHLLVTPATEREAGRVKPGTDNVFDRE